MLRRTVLMALTLALVSAVTVCASQDDWWEFVDIVGIGAHPGYGDGYDGQTPLSSSYLQEYHGVLTALYRQTCPSWSGPTGFYWQDFESPIPMGESKTWSDIYLWAQNPTSPVENLALIWCTREHSAPVGYTASLVLDYVPESLNYTGPMVFTFDLQTGHQLWLPTPTLTFVPDPSVDGDKLTRMHITVYAVPEPSSLAALTLGILPLAGCALRRKHHK